MEKAIAPWNVKPGMKTLLHYPGGLRVLRTVARVVKTRGTFTRCTIWRVHFVEENDGLHLFGRRRRPSGDVTPASKFYQYIEAPL